MPTINVAGFSGVVPRLGPALLAQNQAQIAQNTKLQSGEVRAWRKPLLVFSPVQSAVKSIHKMLGTAGATQWLEWTTDVNVCNGPVADLSDFRLYYTGAGSPKKTNWALASSGTGAKPGAFYEMGVPAPVSMPTLSATGGTAPTETRAYVYTYVSTFGTVKEESAPSLANLVTCNTAGSTVTVGGFATPPVGAYNITHIRIYRNISGATTSTYFQVAEIAIGTGSYADTLTVAQLGAALYTDYFTPPPSGLTGLVSMPNGMLVGFVNNQVWFCEPYYPHAWPSKYSLTVEFPIVGLGVYNNTLVVCTTKNPFLITGSSPASMSQEKLPITQPCVSKRSIVFDQNGVMYASPDGLVSVGPGTQDIITSKLATRDEWATAKPDTMVGVLYDNHYLGFFNDGTNYSGICYSRKDEPALTFIDFPATCVFTETATGNCFGVSQTTNKIYQIDGDNVNIGTFLWRSKRFVMPKPTSFAALKINANYTYMNDISAFTLALAAFNATNTSVFAVTTASLGGCFSEPIMAGLLLNGSNMNTGFSNPLDYRSAVVTIFADDAVVYSTGITNLEPIRLPSGFMAYEWEIQVSGNVPLRGVAMSTSMGELRAASAGGQ